MKLNRPLDVFVSGEEIYIADYENSRVRKILGNGQSVTICGTGRFEYNGDNIPATQASLYWPSCVFVSKSDEVFICDRSNHRVRKIDREGIIHTIAGTGVEGFNGDNQLAIHAQLKYPGSVVVNELGEVIIADSNNYRIRKVGLDGMIETILGGGVHPITTTEISMPATSVCINLSIMGLALSLENDLYFNMWGMGMMKMTRHGLLQMLPGQSGDINEDKQAWGMAVSPSGVVYWADHYGNKIKKWDNGMVTTIAGTGLSGWDSNKVAILTKLNQPAGISLDEDGNLYIADWINSRIRKLTPEGIIEEIAGGGEGYSGDIEFDINKYPHRGPRRRKLLNIVKSLYDITIHSSE